MSSSLAADQISSAVRRLQSIALHLTTVHNDTNVIMSDTAAKSSVFSGVTLAPPDPILGLTLAYKADPSPIKVYVKVIRCLVNRLNKQ